MRLLRIWLVLLATGLSTIAQTNNTANVRELSLQECVELALRNNLEIQVERYNPLINLYSLRGFYGAYDPTFTISGQHSHDEAGTRLLSGGFSVPGSETDTEQFSAGLNGALPWGTTYQLGGNARDSHGESFNVVSNVVVPVPFENSSGEVSASVTQPLLRNLWIDSTRLAIRSQRNVLTQSELGLKLQLMTQITALEQAYYQLIYNIENVLVQEKAVEAADQLLAENRRRVEVGALAPLDEKQAESQAASTRADLIQARSDLAVQENLVKKLISSDYPEWADVLLKPTGTLAAVPQLIDLQNSWARGLTKSPVLLQAKLTLENAGIQLKYSRNQLFPQVDVFATYGYNGSSSEFSGTFADIESRDRPFYTVGGLISIPLAHTATRNAHKADKARLEQQVLLVKRQERDVMVAIHDDTKRVQASFEQVGATRAAREYAEEALSAERKKLESGKSTTYTVLQMQRDLTSARGNEIRALATYNQNLSQLSFDEGTTLERLGIDFDVK